MKHLISLSFKYLRRQKLRSVLTFLCIMVAVFILNTFTAYLGSTMATLVAFEKDANGSWEVKLDNVLKECEGPDDVSKILSNHAAVEDHYFSYAEELWALGSRDENGFLRYLDIQFDNGANKRIVNYNNHAVSGTPSVMYSSENLQYVEDYGDIPENGVIFPYWVKELGYEVGDEISMTITPVRAKLSDDSEQVKAAREWIVQNSTELNVYGVWDEPDGVVTNHSGPLLHFLLKLYDMDEIIFSDEISGTPCTFTVNIAGFGKHATTIYTNPDDVYLEIYSNPVNDIRIEELISGSNADFLAGTDNEIRSWGYASARISDKIDFDDGVKMLIEDLGLAEKHYYDLEFHDVLLAYEVRSATAISSIMPLIVAVLLMALAAWAICRFVIDNAFEISVQERSAQFAVLRIMGASRAQLVALVFTEAIFYCLTAVPIGIFAAFYACKAVMELLGRTLFPIFTFDVNPIITLIGIVLTLAGIIISTYTSAMWAARKLSPMEALQYGKPHKNARALKRRRSNLKQKSVGFVLDYTMKNISRTKSRYVISTIAMALGVMMFSFSVLGINLVNSVVKKNLTNESAFDYRITLNPYKTEHMQLARELFEESGVFSTYRESVDGMFKTMYYEEDSEKLQQMQPDGKDAFLWDSITVELLDKENYEALIEPQSGMTYDEFTATKSALVYVCSGGGASEREWDDYGNYVRKTEDGYWSYQDLGFSEPPVIRGIESDIPVIGAVCYDYNAYMTADAALLITDVSVLDEQIQKNMYGAISLTVDGHKNYEKAKAAIEQFQSEVSGTMLEDYYMEYTGILSFASTIFKTLSVFLISVWLVGILTMVNSINTSVLNRQNELLMLRAVGMTKRQLKGTVLMEGILYSAVSTILGLLLGIGGYWIFVNNFSWDDSGLALMQGVILPIILTVIGVIILNLIIAALAALPALDSLQKRMK